VNTGDLPESSGTVVGNDDAPAIFCGRTISARTAVVVVFRVETVYPDECGG